MKNLLICFLSGVATSLGYFFCYLKVKKERLIVSTLALAASIMFLMSIFELIPEGFLIIKRNYVMSYLITIIFFLGGIAIALSINKIIKNDEDKLYHVGIYATIGLIIHNVLEGFITYLTLKIDSGVGIKMAFSIALHNIPEGISIAIPLFYSEKGKSKLFKNLVLLSLSEIFGALLAFTIFKNVGLKIVGELYLVIAGIMTYISLFELYKESFQYKEKKLILLFSLIGFLIVGLLQII